MAEPLASTVERLRHTSVGDIGVHASLTVARQRLESSLVDELHLVVAPRTLGSGRRLLNSLSVTR
ncbi:MAG: dihydrofolate reductase family protein [Acidobacteria bacterium]|nr:dihydrofolate reductase family protein [Acidobacteriota bacterium]